LSEKLKWQPAEHTPEHRENEPTQEEFFSHDDVISEVASLVRESTQNSLDERLDASMPVRMIFTIGEQSTSVNKEYFSDLVPHIDAVPEIQTPDLTKKAKFLVIEDFNTLGLEGGISAVARTDAHLEKIERDENASKESFYYFQWKSGGSNKRAGSKGSWGVGKIVYPRASAAKSYLVYSVRRSFKDADAGPELLFGLSILNYRFVDGKRFVPDSPWMIRNPEKFNHPIPSEDQEEIGKFISDWKLSRTEKQTGTSIVVPFCNEEITSEKLIQSICRDYFINILSGVLECEVKNIDGSTIVLTKSTLINVIKTLDEEMTTRASKSGTELVKLCEMFEKYLLGESDHFEINYAENSPNNWNSVTSLADSTREDMERALEGGQILEVKIKTLVPETIDPRKGKIPAATDTFRILMQKTNSGSSSTVFCREGILIPDANNNSKLQDITTLVLIGDVAGVVSIENSLASLLKWSEGPSHETWSSGATKFGQRYKPKKAGEDVIRWVKNASSRVLELILDEDEVSDDKSLSDYVPDDDNGLGNDTTDTNLPKVSLSVVRGATAKVGPKLVWQSKNFSQVEFELYQLLPASVMLHSGTSDNTYDLVSLNPSENYQYQVCVSDGSQKVLSNKVTIKPQIPTNEKVKVSKSSTGFQISPIDLKRIAIGELIEVRGAYPSRNDTSVAAWSENDFILSNQIEPSTLRGLKTIPTGKEKMLFEILDSDFEAVWHGFDPLRDLVVQARIVEA
jgi:hypothetical protein